MEMKVNSKMLHIPPFISTSWENIISLHLEDEKIIITLINGAFIELPPLDPPLIELIFAAHARHLTQPSEGQTAPLSFPLLKIAAGNLDTLGTALQHNPEQANIPDLPRDVLDKIGTISKAMGIEDPDLLPKAEARCNCVHCQIARAIAGEKKEEAQEEIVSDADLTFRAWDIAEKENNFYLVTNPLDDLEQYTVCLGDSIGCTCGSKNCEHIHAVLNS